jgi:hypothetical protein
VSWKLRTRGPTPIGASRLLRTFWDLSAGFLGALSLILIVSAGFVTIHLDLSYLIL